MLVAYIDMFHKKLLILKFNDEECMPLSLVELRFGSVLVIHYFS